MGMNVPWPEYLLKMGRKKFAGNLRYKYVTLSRSDDRTYQVIVSNNSPSIGFWLLVDYGKNQRKRKDKYLGFAREVKKTVEQKGWQWYQL